MGIKYGQFERLKDAEIITGFLGKEVPHQAVMIRALSKAGRGHLADSPLPPIKGAVEKDADGNPLVMADYLLIAGRHKEAVAKILHFVAQDPEDTGFEESAAAMGRLIDLYAPVQPQQPSTGEH